MCLITVFDFSDLLFFIYFPWIPQLSSMLCTPPHLNVFVAVGILDLLKMSDETDLDILNHSMEVMVDQFQTELLPVAAMLTARLVCTPSRNIMIDN